MHLLPIAALAEQHVSISDFERPLTTDPADPNRGRDIVFARDRGNCIVCHAIPAPDMALHGNVGPPLKGVGAKRSVAELRMRLVDSRLIDPKGIMPPYHSVVSVVRVGKGYEGRPVLTAQEIEDVVAFLATLKD